MRHHLKHYGHLPRDVYRLSAGEFVLHTVNSAFLLIFNLYLTKLGHSDSTIGHLTALRYLGVLLAALPIGLYIRGRALRPLFMASAFGLPVVSCWLLWGVESQPEALTLILMFLWGLLFALMQVCIQPYVIRHVDARYYSEAFALHYAVVPLSQVAAGLLIAVLGEGGLLGLGERDLLLGFSMAGLLAAGFFWGLHDKVAVQDAERPLMGLRGLRGHYHWGRILRAMVPTVILAVGAGFTFPFLNLFFYQVFGVDSGGYGLMGALSSVLVFGMVVIGPAIKRSFGFGWAITGTQALAVFLLLGLALSELWVQYSWALGLAITMFLLRAPLMKAAQPMAGELTMLYVGRQNREIISAFTSSIWSGSWVLSSQLFALMRDRAMPYWQIFLITGVLYAVGVVSYILLIRAVNRMEPEAA